MFTEVYHRYQFTDCQQEVESQKIEQVENALHHVLSGQKSRFDDYLALISPAAENYLEIMAQISAQKTAERFGKAIQLFMPLYLSNQCRSSCLYCGFSYENKIARKTLSFSELEQEGEYLAARGIKHVLLLTGEDYSKTPVSYIAQSANLLKKYFPSLSVEVYAMSVEKYRQLIDNGVEALVLYQETYDPDTYQKYHLRGMKKKMQYRLEAPDRGAQAGFRRIGIGALLGLSNPEAEMYLLGLHIDYLYQQYWRTALQASLPRMRPAEGQFDRVIPVADRKFLQFLFALRIQFPDLALSLSTREPVTLRDHLLGLGITTLSAESRTDPGGYSGGQELEQFETGDKRTVEEVVEVVRQRGFDPVFKDFDYALIG